MLARLFTWQTSSAVQDQHQRGLGYSVLAFSSLTFILSQVVGSVFNGMYDNDPFSKASKFWEAESQKLDERKFVNCIKNCYNIEVFSAIAR